jgi:hypothetical protein
MKKMKISKRVALLPILFLLALASVSYAIQTTSIVATVTVLCKNLVINIISPTNTTYNKEDVPLNFTISEPVTTIFYILDNGKPKTITNNTTLEELKDGAHNIIIYAKDSCGNTGASNKIYFFYCLADVNNDKKIDTTDINLILNHFGQKCGSKKYDSTYDLNSDCQINVFDVLIALVNYGKKCK